MKMKSLCLVVASLIAVQSPVKADDSARETLSRAELVRLEVVTREAQEKVNDLKEKLDHQLDLQRKGLTPQGEKIRVTSSTLYTLGFVSAVGILVAGPTRGGKSTRLTPAASKLTIGAFAVAIVSLFASHYSEDLVSLLPDEAEDMSAQLELALEHLEQEKAKLAEMRVRLAN